MQKKVATKKSKFLIKSLIHLNLKNLSKMEYNAIQLYLWKGITETDQKDLWYFAKMVSLKRFLIFLARYVNFWKLRKMTCWVRTLRQEVTQFTKQTYEKRLQLNEKYNASNTNQSVVPKSELSTMSEYFFYVQSMRDRIANFSR